MSNPENINCIIRQEMEIFRRVDGYLGAGVYTPEGVMLGGVTQVAGINFEIAGQLFHDVFLIAENRSIEAGFGITDTIQVNSKKVIIFAKCFREGAIHFHTILVVDNDANIGMARLMLQKFSQALKEYF